MSQTVRLQKVAAVIAGPVVFIVMALCLTGCASSSKTIRAEELPDYGASLPGTIRVTVLQGFRRPGHYHLPQGATLGQLLDRAKLKPFAWGTGNSQCWQYIAVEMPRPARGRQMINREGLAGLTVSAEDRNIRLRDGQQVRCDVITW